MELERELKKRLATKPILLMTHLVLGYPSLEVNREVIRQMAENGVDCIELQIPFSEPMADGPVILKANQESLNSGLSVEDCFRFGQEMAAEFPARPLPVYDLLQHRLQIRRGTLSQADP